MFNDNEWLEFRAEVRAFMKEKEESLIKTWLEKIGYKSKEPIGYYIDLSKHTMEIYSTRPGPLIGKAGVNVDLLKKMLKDDFRGEWTIKCIEIRGGFVQI